MRDLDERRSAGKWGRGPRGGIRINYVKLDGNVGCMVNGAGLAMATNGHDQAIRRGACQLSGCRWRSQCADRRSRIQDHKFKMTPR